MRILPLFFCSINNPAASAADVASANVVGYTRLNVNADQFYMVAVQFQDIDATTDVANLNNFLGTTCAPGAYGDGSDGTMANAPQIQVLNSNGLGYTKYYYINDAYDLTDTPVDGNCWADSSGYIVEDADVLDLSKGFWFKAMTEGTITSSGQVSATTEIKNSPTANQFNIVANPYPVALGLNTATTEGFTPGAYGDGSDGTMANAPQIQVLNSNGLGYTKYYYINDAYDLTDTPVDGNCWADSSGYIVEDTQVPVGQAFWVKSPSAGTFTFGN